MNNTPTSFYGQQEGERILYAVTPHPISKWLSLAKLSLAVLSIWLGGVVVGQQLPALTSAGLVGFLGAMLLGILGYMALTKMVANNIAYVTNRRIIRFHAHNPFATVARSLAWDQAVKVKTYPPNIIYKIFMIGSVTVHSKSTVINVDTPITANGISNDDLELENVYYYKDLGNYIDKIIYLYNREPANLINLKPFVPKPKGQRD